MDPPDDARLTRGQFLRGAAGVAGLLLGAEPAWAAGRFERRPGASGPLAMKESERILSFFSRPDLAPPRTAVSGTLHGEDAAEGCWLLAPLVLGGAQRGPMIVNARGELVWFRPLPPGYFAMDLKVQTYRGERVLTWWEGTAYGRGAGVIVDSSYREIARVKAGNGRKVDSHEFQLTAEGTALITCTPAMVPADLSGVGGPRQGHVRESIIQEVDVRSGRVLLEWRSLQHVDLDESYLPASEVYDYLHLNSIDVMPDGNLLASARHTWALYKLDRSTGAVIWRLGGKRSDFDMGPGTQFAWQHDARQLADGRITVFDDGAAYFFGGSPPLHRTHSQSRGLVLELNPAANSVELARSYVHRPALLATSLGSVQALPSGDAVVCWGSVPVISQFSGKGRLRQDLKLPLGYSSYRGFRQPWSATPRRGPAIAVRRDRQHEATVYVSWNGATHVHAWQISAGPDPSALRPLRTVQHRGFETAIRIRSRQLYVRAAALDDTGHELATTRTVRLRASGRGSGAIA